MIIDMARLTAWELRKLRRRWMPYVLLAPAVFIAQLGLWLTYAAYHSETVNEAFGVSFAVRSLEMEAQAEDGSIVSIAVRCTDLSDGKIPSEIEAQMVALPEQTRQRLLDDIEQFHATDCNETLRADELRTQQRRAFTIPDSVIGAFRTTTLIGPILIMVLAASAVGSEYGWGTLRTVLTTGADRWRLLASKFASVLLIGVLWLIALGLLAAIASAAATAIPPAEAGGLFDSERQWPAAAITFGKAAYALVPYTAVAVFLAVLTASSGAGIAFSVTYHVAETLFIAPILATSASLSSVRDVMLGPSVTEWMRLGTAGETPPAPLDEFLTILAYAVALGAAAFWLFLRRDITGAKGS